MRKLLLCLAATAFFTGASLRASRTAGVDPLTARVEDSDARRFADLWAASRGKPTAVQLQADYLARGTRAIAVFTPQRIVSAEHLAQTIDSKPALYRDAVERCLPWVKGTNAALRSSYLGLRGLLPDRPLPQIAVVIGANNSGGTAAPGIQVIGLEVVCRLSRTRADFEKQMRQFFTHETVHTFQPEPTAAAQKDMLLFTALQEGVPEYVTELVTGEVPDSARNAWAVSREPWIWQQFLSDAAIVKAGTNSNGNMNKAAKAAFHRWFANAGDPPPGWPGELGYWVGMRIAEAYVQTSPNPHAAIDWLIEERNPPAILKASGYGGNFKHEG